MMCGGPSEVKEATGEVTELCNEIKADLEDKCGKKFTTFTPLSYKSQVVAGTNFFVKIFVESDQGSDHIHVRIFKPLPHTKEPPSLHSYQEGKTKDDDIALF